MTALHLVPISPALERSEAGNPPARRLVAVPEAGAPAPRQYPAGTAATPRPGNPGDAARNGRLLQTATENREVCAITRGTVQAAIEVLAGTRPIQQLSRRLDQRCLASLQHRAALTRRLAAGPSPTAGRLHRNPAVRSVRACEVASGIYEASAVVVDELRVRAVAVRLERSNQVWRITALEIG
ncbi:Rv3235 family protein [Arthrobacter sp. NPDC058288]|uniref:Rv3235 family protein n=1 Tax=Arthrobacter sp. NPDC058288 TaxID=3346424 RepID=UPI0036E33BF5